MKTTVRKSLAMVLCAVMLLAALPLQALAATEADTTPDASVSVAQATADSATEQADDPQPPPDSALPEDSPAPESATAPESQPEPEGADDAPPAASLPEEGEAAATTDTPDADAPTVAPEESASGAPGTAAEALAPEEGDSPVGNAWINPPYPSMEEDEGFTIYCELYGLETNEVGLVLSSSNGYRVWESAFPLQQGDGFQFIAHWFGWQDMPIDWQPGGYYFEVFLNPHDTWTFENYWTIATFTLGTPDGGGIKVDDFAFSTTHYTMGSGTPLAMEGRFTTTYRSDEEAAVVFFKVDDDAVPPDEDDNTSPEGDSVFEEHFYPSYHQVQVDGRDVWQAEFWRTINNPYFTQPGRWFAWLRTCQYSGQDQPLLEHYTYLGSLEVQRAPAMLIRMNLGPNSATIYDASINHHAGTVKKWLGYATRPADITAVPVIFEVPEGATLTVDGVEQVSGVSTQDFSGPVTFRVTSADGSTHKDYVATIEVAEPSTDAQLSSFRFSDLPAGSEALLVDHGQGLIYTMVPGHIESLVLTPVFEKPYYATASLQSGVALDFENSTETPVELTVTAEDGITQKTYRIVVGRKAAPSYYGQVFTYNGGETQTIAGRQVLLYDMNRDRYYNNPLATTTTDSNGRYAFYTDAIPGVEEMDLIVRPVTIDAPGDDGNIYGEHGVPVPGTSYAGYYGANWVPCLRPARGASTDFHLFAGSYVWKSRVVDANTGLGVPNATVNGAYYGYSYVHNTNAYGVFLEEPMSAYAMAEYLRHETSQTVFTARKAGYRDTQNIVVELNDVMYEELKTNASFTTPTIQLVPASNEAAILSFTVAGHNATINENDKTIRLMLPFIESVNLSSVAVQFTLPELATASPRSGSRLDFSNSLANPVPITVTAEDTLTTVTYQVTVEMEPDIQVDYSGTVQQYGGQGLRPAAGSSLMVQDTWGRIIKDNVTCDSEGRFSFTITGSQAGRGVYINRSQSPGQLVKPDLSGFYTASVLYRLQPGSGNALIFATAPSGSEIRGVVQDASGNRVAGAEIHYLSKLAESLPDGSFGYTIDNDWLRYHHTSFTVRKDGFNQAGFRVDMQSVETFRSLLENSYIDVGVITLSPATGSPVQLGQVAAMPQYTQRGKTVQTFVHYTGSRTLEDAVLTVTVPAGVTIEPGSLTNPGATLAGNTITLRGTLQKGEAYTLGFWASAGVDYAGSSFAVTAQVAAGGNTWAVGESQVSLTDLSLEVPHQVGLDGSHSLPFTISGQATAGPGYSIDIEITNPDGQPAVANKALTGLPPAGVGPWFKVAGVVLQNAAQSPGQYTLLATLKDNSGNPVAYDTATLYVVPDAIKLRSINMTSYYFNVTAPQPVTNSSFVSACAYVNNDLTGRDPIDLRTTWENDSDVVSAIYVMETSHGTFLSTMSEKGNGRYTGRFRSGGYMGSGTAHIYLEFGFEDGSAARFLVGKLLLLIDPSGYVYDKTTNQRVEGATATLEYKHNGAWVFWPAEEFGQHNPQTTDGEGRYGWFVPEGEYRVLVSAEGYEPYATTADPAYGVINVLPPRDDIHIGLTPKQALLSRLEITANPTKTQYHAGQLLDLTGLEVTAQYDDGSRRVLGASEYSTSPAAGAALATPGAVQVTVKHREGSVEKTARFTVQVAAVVLTSIELTTPPTKTAYHQGDTLDLAGLTVTARYSDGSSRTLPASDYTTSPAAGAALATPGAVQVTVKHRAGSVEKTAQFTVQVAAVAVTLTGIEVTTPPTKTAYNQGDTLDLAGLTVTARYSDGSSRVLATGAYTASPAAGTLLDTPGAAQVTLRYQEGDAAHTATVALQVAAPSVVLATGVLLAPSQATLAQGETLQLAATVQPEDADNKAVSWASSDTTVATVDANGLVAAVQHGMATITATTADGGFEAACHITVIPVVTEVQLAQKSLRLAAGQKVTVAAVATLSDGTTTTEGLRWESSNPDVATVAETGKVTAAKNLQKEGKATITAKAGNGVSAQVAVTVLKRGAKAVKVKKVGISGIGKTLEAGSTRQLKAKVSPANATGVVFSWKSSKPAVLSVDATGRVTALQEGTAILTLKAGNGRATVKVTVVAPVQSLKFKTKTLRMKPKQKQTLAPAITLKNDHFAGTPKLAWASNNKKVATVNSKGVVKAVGKGKARITVKAQNGKKATVTIVVAK